MLLISILFLVVVNLLASVEPFFANLVAPAWIILIACILLFATIATIYVINELRGK